LVVQGDENNNQQTLKKGVQFYSLNKTRLIKTSSKIAVNTGFVTGLVEHLKRQTSL
jgi:hypothetical protein